MSRDFSKNTSNYMSLGVGAIGGLIANARSVSFAAWVVADTLTTTALDNRVINTRINGGSTGAVLNLESADGATAAVRFGCRADGNESFASVTATGATAFPVGQWVHVGGVADFARGLARVYLNGRADGAVAVTYGAGSYVAGTPTAADVIGAADAPSSGSQFQLDGRIAEFGVWRGDIGDAGFAELAGLRGRPLCPGLVSPDMLALWLPMQGITSPEPDLRSGLVGTITGTVGAYEHPPVLYQRPARVAYRTRIAASPSTSRRQQGPMRHLPHVRPHLPQVF